MKYMLRAPHIIEGAMRSAGTIVGDDDDCPVRFYGDPTPDMTGLDEASAAKVNEVHNRLYGAEAPWHRDPNADDPRFRGFGSEPPALEQDRAHAEMDVEERAKAEEESNKAMAEANARYHNMDGTAPAQTIPAPGAGSTMTGPAAPDTDQTQVQRPTQPMKEMLPAEGPLAKAETKPQDKPASSGVVTREKPRS
jgi:hypothetical protein